jgi:hypothetical protein
MSVYVRVSVTDVEVVEAAPALIVMEPVGAVLSSFMPVRVWGVSSLPMLSALQYSSVLSAPSVVMTGCPSALTV